MLHGHHGYQSRIAANALEALIGLYLATTVTIATQCLYIRCCLFRERIGELSEVISKVSILG